MAQIEISGLYKEYRVYKKKGRGIWEALRHLAVSRYEIVQAVKNINLTIEKGEAIGFIGPNGAGKSTTIKMLTGVLVPSSGRIMVLGAEPHKERIKNAWRIGVVFGQRTQLWWDLPCYDSFAFLRHLYKIPENKFRRKMEIFGALLDLDSFISVPVRQLSLGQRMRADIAAAMLHDPDIIYFDEPTIGLDIVAKEKIRQFIKHINEENKVTMFFTTHDMRDIERICRRIIVLDKGRVIYDGSIREIQEKYGEYRVLIVDFKQKYDSIDIPETEVIRKEALKYWIRFKRDQISVPCLIAEIGRRYEINDLAIQEPEIETMIQKIYTKEPDFAHQSVR